MDQANAKKDEPPGKAPVPEATAMVVDGKTNGPEAMTWRSEMCEFLNKQFIVHFIILLPAVTQKTIDATSFWTSSWIAHDHQEIPTATSVAVFGRR